MLAFQFRLYAAPLVIVLAGLGQGCASISPPVPVISDTAEAELGKEFDASLATVKASLSDPAGKTANPLVTKVLIESGMALADLHCKGYFRNLGLAAQQYAYARKEVGLTGGATAGIQGLTGVSAKLVAITAGAFSFATSSMEGYADAFLFSPDVAGVEQLVATSQSAYRSAMPTIAPPTYGEAIRLLRAYDALCEVQTIRRLINESISTAKPVATTFSSSSTPITPSDRAAIATSVGVASVTTDEVAYMYWLLLKQPSDDEKNLIASGLKGIPFFVGADAKLKTLSAQDAKKVRDALTPILIRDNGEMDAQVSQLKSHLSVSKPKTAGAAESTAPNGGTTPQPALLELYRSSDISVRISR